MNVYLKNTQRQAFEVEFVAIRNGRKAAQAFVKSNKGKFNC